MCPNRVRMHLPLVRFQILMLLSPEQLIKSNVSVDSSPHTQPIWPWSVLMHSLVSLFQILMVLSLEPLAKWLFFSKHKDKTSSVWPWNVWTHLLSFKFQNLIVLSLEQLTKVSLDKANRQWIQLVWPSSVCMHLSSFKSNIWICPRDPMATRLPDKHFILDILHVHSIVFKQTPSLEFHTLSDLSSDPLITWPLASALMNFILPVCPSSDRIHSFVSKSHSLIVLSLELLT